MSAPHEYRCVEQFLPMLVSCRECGTTPPRTSSVDDADDALRFYRLHTRSLKGSIIDLGFVCLDCLTRINYLRLYHSQKKELLIHPERHRNLSVIVYPWDRWDCCEHCNRVQSRVEVVEETDSYGAVRYIDEMTFCQQCGCCITRTDDGILPAQGPCGCRCAFEGQEGE